MQKKVIKPLRTYHFFIWRILAVLLPVVFCLAIVLRPATPADYQMSKDDFSFSLTKQTNGIGQLTIELKNPLSVPSCVAYITSSSHELLLGKIDQMGTYHFNISAHEKTVTVKLYDPVHKKEITRAEVFYNNE